MSHDRRKPFYGRQRDTRDPDPWERPAADYRSGLPRKRSRSLTRRDLDKRRSRSPRKGDKDMLDDNILSEIAKLPEPNELWDNNQYQDGVYAPPPPTFSRDPPNPSYTSSYQQPQYSGIYDDFPPGVSAPQHPSDMSSWNQMALPPPPPAPHYHNPEDQLKKEAAIESEMRHQKAALSKQREDYIKKANILKKELETLKDQRSELRGDAKRSPSPDTKRFLKENTKLQLEIQNKLKTINNVVDMLNGIIGEEAQEIHETDESPERKRKSRSPCASKKFNYVYYDPEMHWCRVCNEFPPTAKDYLNHLHSAAHHKMAAQHMEAPWHSVTGVNDGFPNLPNAPTKRTPIRGLQFFVPSTAWYCKLCDQFIGDLHCASAHLKSQIHSKNYTNFVEQNPHWETDWMSDRQKAFEKVRHSSQHKNKGDDKPQYTAHTITFSKDGFHTKRPKKSPSPQLEEKKKKKDKKKKSKKKRGSSSSSSSHSDTSDTDSGKKKKSKTKKQKNVDVNDEKALEAWMSNIQVDRLSDTDRKLLDSLKTKIKKERDEKQMSNSRDIERITEMQRKLRQTERSEPERERDRPAGRKHEGRESRSSRERREPSRERRDKSRERKEARGRDRWDKREDGQDKKPEIRKMPFIGKMPVYKVTLGKVKTEEQKKEEQKKKEETDVNAKKRQEMDAEIQKKVAEFKQKIAKAQLVRAQVDLPPPAVALPSSLGSHVPHVAVVAHTQQSVPASTPAPAPAPAAPAGPPALPADLQEALDIIFPDPAADKPRDLYLQPPPPLMSSCVPPVTIQQFQPMGMPMHHQPPPNMFSFDMTGGLFPQAQLYDSHVPLLPGQHSQHNQNKPRAKPPRALLKKMPPRKPAPAPDKDGEAAAKKREELDDLAMLGIDATDVGAGI